MACHLDGGSCPHEYSMGKGGSYPVFGSSSYGGGGNYAGLQMYNPLGKMSGQYDGAGKGTMGYAPLFAGNPLAAYATNPTYDAAYTAAGNYASQSNLGKSGANAGVKKIDAVLAVYRNNPEKDNNERNQEQQFIASDTARPAPTIDDTIDERNVVAVQRNFLEQMIRNARQQTVALQQPQYMVMYQ